jgi:hypothetical protein
MPGPPLVQLTADQLLHFVVIVLALGAGGYLHSQVPGQDISAVLHKQDTLVILLGYAFLTMPAWCC